MIESRYGVDSRLIFRETFESAQNTARLGGTATAVTFSDGVGSFNGTSSRIFYKTPLNGTYTQRVRLKINNYNHAGYIFTTQGSVLTYSNGTIGSGATTIKYIDGVLGTLIPNDGKYHEVIATGANINDSLWYIGYNDVGAGGYLNAGIELIEIYKGTLTAGEVKNLYEDKSYRELPAKTSTYETVLDIDPRQGVIADRYSSAITNNSVSIVSGNGWYSERYTKSSSYLSLGSPIDISSGATLCAWVKSSDSRSNHGVFFNNIFGRNLSFYTYYNNNNPIIFAEQSGNLRYFIDTKVRGKDGKWHFWVWQITGLGQNDILNSKCFVDGEELVASSTVSVTVPTVNTINHIGTNNFSYSSNEEMGRKMIIKGLLSSQEISQIYTSQKFYYV